ncbi:hypothetical protein TanjilG_17366 [Lupinus angustifolius]|uniref:Uncharacterized protein n=1 Tax=Lupinus angustifolius TaxID=3871 RepID=A0A4P1R1G5_LUPAN|nr:hypothetical protein TanjilG_17366 [Lupinus angustifolius]
MDNKAQLDMDKTETWKSHLPLFYGHPANEYEFITQCSIMESQKDTYGCGVFISPIS